ncbi:hemin ABC transporter substrate-binding protein [Archangium sp. Cb G35]|uniref:heme/hemin ABC transporter substrate-binding protein n=1 Tax=Archangium sp. Cb G35 TaxID=1920190 RepID=UPI0009376F03|nr:ABC transporter substrate-binding protein [Archangium sp. Cb G35]OJT23521.1 hemin ABC transporter substrate-binding protein [Archangium sp. Cb G35]
MKHPAYLLLLMSAVIASPLAQAALIKGVDGQSVDIAPPKRVVAVNSSLVEILFGLGKGETIVGTDIGGTWPPEQAKITKVGHPYHPSLEGIISLKPELVLATEENLTPATAGQLRSAGIPVLVLENSSKDGIDGLKRRIGIVARLLNVQDAGKRMIQELDKQRSELDKKIAALGKKPRILFLYAHGPGEAFVYGKDTGVHVLIELAGGQNAADFTSGTKTLTAEGLVLASPDAILMMNRGLEAVGGVDGALKLPGVALTPAGKNRKIITVDDTIRWVGPRFPQFADTIFKAIHAKPSR